MKMTGRHYLNYLKLYDKNRVFVSTDNYLERPMWLTISGSAIMLGVIVYGLILEGMSRKAGQPLSMASVRLVLRFSPGAPLRFQCRQVQITHGGFIEKIMTFPVVKTLGIWTRFSSLIPNHSWTMSDVRGI